MTIDFSKTPEYYANQSVLSDDRIIELEAIPGEHTKSESGQVNNRLFKPDSGNNLHVVKDPQTNMWKFRFEKGAVPGGLEGMYTSFSKALVYAESYFKRRGVRIRNVIE